MIFRLAWLSIRSRFGPRIQPTEVARTGFRVWPTDLDVLMHMNNGVYLSIMDLGRIDLMARSGAWDRFLKKSGGSVPIDELAELFGLDPAAHPLPEWVREWSERAALPTRREPAPSTWEI